MKPINHGITTQYIYDARGNLIAEADAGNAITRYYIYGAGLLAMVKNNNVYTYLHNPLGSTVALTDNSRRIINTYSYTPYGQIVDQTETIKQPFKYVGKYGVMTEANGLYYMRARYYDPTTGRFMSEDPKGFGGGQINLYAYVGGNPVMGIDPLGLTAENIGYFGAAKRYMSGQGGVITVNASAIKLIKTGANEGIVCCTSDYAVHGNVGLDNDGKINSGKFNFDMKPLDYYGNTWKAETALHIRNTATRVLEVMTYAVGGAANFAEGNFSLHPKAFLIKYKGQPNLIYDGSK